MSRILLCLALLFGCAPATVLPPQCTPQADRLCPEDEGTSDPSFAAYRRELIAAVNEKNETKLRALVDPKIRTSFGNGGGIESFRPDWNELAEVLSLGGAFREGMFWAPYVYANWQDDVDAFQHVAAIRGGVAIHAKPDDAAQEIARVDWAILELVPVKTHDPAATWRHVRTKDGKDGRVRASDVRSPIDYRAGFSKRSGAWKMEAFVAGD